MTRRFGSGKRGSFSAAAGMLGFAAACASAAPPAATVAPDAVRRQIVAVVQRATGLAPASVEPSAVLPGYYEVRAKESVAYVDAQARVLIKGPVIDLATGENLSLRNAPGTAARIDVGALRLADAIVSVTGKGQRMLYVFVDPNCGFCRALEPELARLTNVSIYRFVMPALGPGSTAVARRIWCSADRAASWRQAVSGHGGTDDAAAARCDASALDRNLALAKRLGVIATPTLVFASGERVAALLRAGDIEARLSRTMLAAASR